MNQNNSLESIYRAFRANGARACNALRAARYRLNREQTIGGTIGRTLVSRDLVRVRIEPDDDCYAEDRMGDCFDPCVNPDINPRKLEAERKEYIEMAEQHGYCGLISEIREHDEAPWQEVDSCWGFEAWGDGLKDEEADFLARAIEAWMESGWELE